jgi:hypothetical protein
VSIPTKKQTVNDEALVDAVAKLLAGYCRGDPEIYWTSERPEARRMIRVVRNHDKRSKSC